MTLRVKNELHLGGLLPAHVTRDALQDGADFIKDAAVQKAPLLTGDALRKANDERRAHPGELRESAYVRLLDDNTAEVGFSAFYAAWQHERMDYHHEDGQSKFLEEPLATDKDAALDVITARLREGLGR